MEATVVSIIPFAVKSEFKPGLFPGEYNIPPGPSTLVVLDAKRGVYLDHDRGSEAVSVSASTVARALVDDYVISQPAQDQTAGPGLFWVEGAYYSFELIEKKFPEKLVTAQKMQKEWWTRLVRLADDQWQRSHQITQLGDLDRHACRALALKRDWLDDTPDSIFKCPVCTTMVSSAAVVCFACKAILKPEEYKHFQFAGAGPVQTLNTKA